MEGNEDHSAMSIHDAISASSGQVESQESTEQQATEEVQTSEVTETTAQTQETSSETQEEGEKQETETDETKEQETVASEGSRIIDVIPEETNKEEENSTENSELDNASLNFGEILEGAFESEEDLGEYITFLQSKVEELEKVQQPEFANEAVQKLNEHVNNGGTVADFMRVQGANVDEMSPVEKLSTALVMQYKITEAQAREHIQETYDLADDEDGSNNTKVIIDSKKAGEAIKALQADDTPGKVSGLSEEEWNAKTTESQRQEQEAFNAEETVRMDAWESNVEKTVQAFKEKGLRIDIGGGKVFQYDFGNDAKEVESLVSQALEGLYQTGASAEEAPGLAREMIEMKFKSDNFDKILKAYGNQIANSKNEEWFKETHNPSVIARGDKMPQQSKELPSAEEAMNKLWSQ